MNCRRPPIGLGLPGANPGPGNRTGGGRLRASAGGKSGDMGKVRQREWIWHFDRPVDAIWEILADTARFNEAAKLPKHEIIETPQPDGSVQYVGRIKRGPFTLEWQERPVNWIHHRWFEHCRGFPQRAAENRSARSFELAPEAGGCRGTYRISVEPRNLLGELILVGGVLPQRRQDLRPIGEGCRRLCGRSARRAVPL